jgi:glycosyltransferase involved in cell wall biosynthesis
VAARSSTDPASHARLLALRGRLGELRYFDGYTHATLDAVLAGVNLGVVPVLWEDNLPQIAIEMVARGIPILTADRGGASEIANSPAFTFPAGDHGAMTDRLRRIADGTIDMDAFWATRPRLFSMTEHLADLERHYRPAPAESA